MKELQIGDKTELGVVLMKFKTRREVNYVFSNENKYNEKCVDIEKSEPVPDYSEDSHMCLEKFEFAQDLYGNRIEDDNLIRCILFEAHSEEYCEVIRRIISYESLIHEQVTVGDVRKIIEKIREENQ